MSDSSLKPYIVIVGDSDFVTAVYDFLEQNLPGYAVFVARNTVETVHTMHRLDRSAIFVIEDDLPDMLPHMGGLLLVTENIRRTFRFDSFCIVMTDDTELISKVSEAKILCRRKTKLGESSHEKKGYNLDAYLVGNVKYAVEELKELQVDPLTKIFTHTAAMRRWERDFAAARTQKATTAFLLGDLNDLKWINDTYGHLVADQFIRAIGVLFRKFSRDPYDYAARLGRGDEFGLFMPFTNRRGAEIVRDRIQEHLQELSIEVSEGVFEKPSMSFGISVLKPSSLGRSAEEAYRQMFNPAEVMMYRNKLAHYERLVEEQPENEEAKKKLDYYKAKRREKAASARKATRA